MNETEPITETQVPHLYRIELPTPFPVGNVNCYLAEGKPLTLIDCGPDSFEPAYRKLTAAFEALGYDLGELGRIVITHHHADHSGMAGRLAAETGAEIWTHEYNVPWLDRDGDLWGRRTRFMTALWRQGGVPEQVIERMLMVFEWVRQFYSRRCEVTHFLQEGDTIPLGGTVWKALYLPGHTVGMICPYQPEWRVLLSGDHLLKHITSNALIEGHDARTPDERRKPLLQYIEQLKRTAGMGIRLALTGHGEPIENVGDLIAERLEFYRQRADEILSAFEDGPHTLYEVTMRLFPHVPEPETFMAISEVLGHFDLLESEGRLRRELRDGVAYWHKIPEA